MKYYNWKGDYIFVSDHMIIYLVKTKSMRTLRINKNLCKMIRRKLKQIIFLILQKQPLEDIKRYDILNIKNMENTLKKLLRSLWRLYRIS